MLSRLSPEIGKAARGELERGRAVCIARIDEIFAGHMAVEKVWQAALDAEEAAILAICEHRCVAIEEIAIKVRHLAGLDCMLTPDQSSAFFASLLPEGEEIVSFV